MLSSQANLVSVLLLTAVAIGLSVVVYFTSQEVLFSVAGSSYVPEYMFYTPPIVNEAYQDGFYLVLVVYNPNDGEINIENARAFFYSSSGDLLGVSDFSFYVGPKEVNMVRVIIPMFSLPSSGSYTVKIDLGSFTTTIKVRIYLEKIVGDVSVLSLDVQPLFYLDGYYKGFLFFSKDSNVNTAALSDVNRVRAVLVVENSLPFSVPVDITLYGLCIEGASLSKEIPPGQSTIVVDTKTSSGGPCSITAEVNFVFDVNTSNNSSSVNVAVWYVYGCENNTECATDVSSACLDDFNAVVVLTSNLNSGIRLENLACSGRVVLEGNLHEVRDNNTALYLSNVSGIRIRNISLYGNYALYSLGSSLVVEQNLSRSSFTFAGSSASFYSDTTSTISLECSGDCSGSKNLFYTYFEGDMNFAPFVRAVAPPSSDMNYVTVLLFSGFSSPEYNYTAPLDANASYPPPDFNTADLISRGLLDSSCNAIRFRDVRGRDLNYWIEIPTCNSWNTRIYVKLAELPTYGMPVFMFHENNSSVPSLSNGEGTFLFFDGFEENVNVTWTDYDSDNDGIGELTWSGDFSAVAPTSPWDGNYAVKVGANYLEEIYIDGGRRTLPFSVARPFVVEAEVYVPTADDGQGSLYYRDGFGVLLDGNGYGATLGHGSLALERFYKLEGNTYTTLYDASSVATTNQWYYKAIIFDAGVLGGFAFREDGSQIYYYIGVSEGNYTSFNTVFLSGGDYAFYDNLRIRQYPSPSMEVLRTLFYG